MARNPLDVYKAAQREVRRHFDPFTKKYCPTCPHPCCVKPARIAPTDILLAQGAGWKSTITLIERDLVSETIESASFNLNGDPDSQPRIPCDHLGEGGCTFPRDLRPFGCTTYICPIMYAELDRKSITNVKKAVRELTRAHDVLTEALGKRSSGRDWDV
ncbi:MAG: hypothetical protein ABJA67_14645 [Chthonomonadales bacterium]